MNRIIHSFIFILLASSVGCRKLAEEKTDISKGIVNVSAPVSDAAPLCGSIKGTMLAGKTYVIDGSCGDITVMQAIH